MTTLPAYAGLVAYRRSRQTGTHVGVYQAQEAGIEEDPAAGRWATVCEEHGGVVLHPTRRLAMSHAPFPLDWCPTCQETPRCAHDGTPLRWADDAWICPQCGDEWSDES